MVVRKGRIDHVLCRDCSRPSSSTMRCPQEHGPTPQRPAVSHALLVPWGCFQHSMAPWGSGPGPFARHTRSYGLGGPPDAVNWESIKTRARCSGAPASSPMSPPMPCPSWLRLVGQGLRRRQRQPNDYLGRTLAGSISICLAARRRTLFSASSSSYIPGHSAVRAVCFSRMLLA